MLRFTPQPMQPGSLRACIQSYSLPSGPSSCCKSLNFRQYICLKCECARHGIEQALQHAMTSSNPHISSRHANAPFCASDCVCRHGTSLQGNADAMSQDPSVLIAGAASSAAAAGNNNVSFSDKASRAASRRRNSTHVPVALRSFKDQCAASWQVVQPAMSMQRQGPDMGPLAAPASPVKGAQNGKKPSASAVQDSKAGVEEAAGNPGVLVSKGLQVSMSACLSDARRKCMCACLLHALS